MNKKIFSYTLNRLFYAIPVLILTSVFMFSLIYLTPGDPVTVMLGMEGGSAETAETLREQLGLNDPPHIRYFRWLGSMLRGNFGTSICYLPGKHITTLIKERIPVTLTLGLFSLGFALLIGIPAGIISATKRGKLTDYTATSLAILGISMPGFWVGFMMIILFSLKLDWLPTIGFVSFFDNPWTAFKHIIMPALAIALPLGAVITRILRSSILENINKDYVEMAKAYGIPSNSLFLHYVLSNSFIATITAIGLNIRYLIAGTVVIEKVFAIPGMGALLADSVFARDFILVQGTVMVLVTAVLLSNLIVDIIYVFLDPRINY